MLPNEKQLPSLISEGRIRGAMSFTFTFTFILNERAVISLCLSADSRTGENIESGEKIGEFHINDYICKDKNSP